MTNRGVIHLPANQFNIGFGRRERIVPHLGTGPGVGKGPVTGDLAVIPLAPACSERFAGRDHRFEGFGRDTKIGDLMVFIISEAPGVAEVFVDQIPGQLNPAVVVKGRHGMMRHLGALLGKKENRWVQPPMSWIFWMAATICFSVSPIPVTK